MDWRAISRSRSRISMDWRPTSRSRSRPPNATVAFDHHTIYGYDYRFPHVGPISSDTRDSHKTNHFLDKHVEGKEPDDPHGIPIPGAMFSPTNRKSPSTSTKELHTDFVGVYENAATLPFDSVGELRNAHSHNLGPPLSTFSSPTLGPSSLPSAGLHGLIKTYGSHAHEPRTFPRHVRKTSFDHTVSKDGILQGVSGRHQVNGKPLSPDSLLGQKRRAEAPHHDSMLRADPSNVNGSTVVHREQDVFDRDSPFPTSAFDFTFQPYEGLVSISPSSINPSGQADLAHRDSTESDNSQVYTSSSQSPVNGSIFSGVGSPISANEGLSPAAVAASAVIAEGYAHINPTNISGADDSLLDYRHLMSLVYPGLESSNGNRSTYTHVDPQILSVQQGEGASSFHNFHPSPSSDGWANGLSSSADASPEPHNAASSASTPPSIEVMADNRSAGAFASGQANQPQRKYIPLKQGAQDLHNNPSSSEEGRLNTLKSADLGGKDNTHVSNKGNGEDGEQIPTLCTNCQTTNTPLWRRNPEGQPLCKLLLPLPELLLMDN
jgi:GATA-binding protein